MSEAGAIELHERLDGWGASKDQEGTIWLTVNDCPVLNLSMTFEQIGERYESVQSPQTPEERCTCGTEGPDEFGNYDQIENPDCPIHGSVPKRPIGSCTHCDDPNHDDCPCPFHSGSVQHGQGGENE